MVYFFEYEFNLMEDILNIERRFCRFFVKTIKDYFDLDKKIVWRAKEISNRKTQKKKHDYVINQPHELLLLGTQDFCLGLRKFYAMLMLMNYKEIAKYLSKKKPLVLYCVIGESVLSALGICAVIDAAVEKYRSPNEKDIMKIQLIVTEKNQKWKSMCSYILERVDSCYKNVAIELVLFDERSDRLSAEVSHKIKEADIVVMSRYLSRFEYLTVRTFLLEVILKRMKELSIIFYLDACERRYEDTVKHVFTKADSLIEIRRKKTAFESLEDPKNEEYFSEFPFLLDTVLEKVMYSIGIKCSAVSSNKSPEKKMKDRRQMKWKIPEIFEKENSLLSQLKTPSKAKTFGNKRNADMFKRSSVAENSFSGNFERINNYSKVKKLKVETVKREKVVGKSTISKLQGKKIYESLDLEVDEPVLDDATVLGEIYYSKHFHKQIPCRPKTKLNKQLKS